MKRTPLKRHVPLRRSKYGAKRVRGDLRSFDSQGEARRAAELELMQKAGVIRELRYQVMFPLHGRDGREVCKYRADFVYQRDGKEVVEDFKGFRTDLFSLKAKLFESSYGFPILETNERTRRTR